jgi:hypothetical protein
MIFCRGPRLYILIVVLILAIIPVGLLITYSSFHYGFPTPGEYAAMTLVPDSEPMAALTPRIAVATVVNAICCYLLAGALAVVITTARRKAKSY